MLNDIIKDLVTQIVARDVAAGVELARSLGHAMPKDFQVGVRFIKDGEKMRVRIRLDDVTYDAIVQLPYLDGRHSLPMVDAMWKVAWERIHADALTTTQVWLDKHPEARSHDAVKSLKIIDALKEDDELSDKWWAACRERAKLFKYEAQ
jgi:hypothetical protein